MERSIADRAGLSDLANTEIFLTGLQMATFKELPKDRNVRELKLAVISAEKRRQIEKLKNEGWREAKRLGIPYEVYRGKVKARPRMKSSLWKRLYNNGTIFFALLGLAVASSILVAITL